MWSHKLISCVTGLAFAPDGRTLYTADQSGRVFAWDTQTRKRRRVVRFPESDRSNVREIAVTGDGRFLLARAHQLQVWELADEPKRLDVPEVFADSTVKIDAARGRLLALNKTSTAVLSWDIARQDAGPVVVRWDRPASEAYANQFVLSADGRTLVIEPKSGQAIFRAVPSGKRTGRIPRNAGWVSDLLVSPDGRTLRCHTHGWDLWDVPAGTPRCRLGPYPWPVAFHATEPVFVGLVGDHGVALGSSETGETIRSLDFQLGGRLRVVCPSPDWHTCAVGASNGRLVVFDLDL